MPFAFIGAFTVAISLLGVVPASVAQAPQSEREILIEFYQATNGSLWARNDGWNTAAPVCDWYGVSCDYLDGDATKPVVVALHLDDNKLVGSLPASLARLPHLKSLSIGVNALRGEFPAALLQKWDSHELVLRWQGNSFNQQLTAVRVELAAGGVLCSASEDLNFTFEVVQLKASMQSVRCADGDGTYCLVRQGTGFGLERLSRALATLDVANLDGSYGFQFGFQTHAATVTTTWTWGDGSKKSLSTYASQGPLRAWMAQQVTLALLADANWETTSQKPKCDPKL